MRVARSGPPARGEQSLSLSPPKSSMQPPISTPATSRLATELNRVFFRVPRSPFRVPRSTFGVSVHPLWLRCLWPAFPSSPSRVARPRAPADCHWCPLATRSTSSRLTSGCSRRTGGPGAVPTPGATAHRRLLWPELAARRARRSAPGSVPGRRSEGDLWRDDDCHSRETIRAEARSGPACLDGAGAHEARAREPCSRRSENREPGRS